MKHLLQQVFDDLNSKFLLLVGKEFPTGNI